MACRLILGTKNASWGVIVDKYNGNRSEVALHFENWVLKDKFLNDNCFAGDDYKILLQAGESEEDKKWFYVPDMLESANTGILKTNTRTLLKYYGEDLDEILNKDMAIGMYKIGDVEKYIIYTISSVKKQGQEVVFELEKDYFMNYDVVNDMFVEDRQAKIIRAHVDRYDDDGNAIIDYESDLIYDEDHNIPDNAFIPTVTSLTNANTSDLYYEIKCILNLSKSDTDYYYLDLFNVGTTNGKFLLIKKASILNSGGATLFTFYTPASVVTTPTTTFNLVKALQQCDDVISISTIPFDKDVTNLQYTDFFIADNAGGGVNPTNTFQLYILPANYFLDNHVLWQKTIDTLTYPIIEKDYTKEFIPKNEVKMYYSKYTKNIFASPFDEKFELINEYNKSASIDITLYSTSSLDTCFTYMFSGNTSKSLYQNSPILNKYVLSTIKSNYQLPMISNAYSDFLRDNSNAINTQAKINKRDADNAKANTVWDGIKNAFSALSNSKGSLLTNMVDAGMSIYNSVTDYSKSNDAINKQAATLADAANQADSITNFGGSFYSVCVNDNDPFPFHIQANLTNNLFNQIANHFNIFGYSMGEKYDNITKYLNTRVHRNYIQAEMIFENFKPELSGPVRQIIMNSFKNGLTIYHVREGIDFKGLKNFNTNNIELKFVERDN